MQRLDECLGRATTVCVVARSPALRRRRVCYSEELADLRSARVRRADNRPQGPVPLLDECLIEKAAVCVVPHGRAIRRRGACHRSEVIILHRTGVGRGDNGPHKAVPVLNERLIVGYSSIVTNSPAVGGRNARHAQEIVVVSAVWR